MSRIEANLLARIENSASLREQASLRSRLAIYYFHKGDCERARRLVDEVRDWAKFNEALEVMVYINLAEATDLYQSAQTEAAIQKAKRAYALSSASPKQSLIALSAIWLGHLEFNECHYLDAIRLIEQCLKTVDMAEPLARTRCYTLIADLLSFSGKSSESTAWYAKARSAAVEEGDEIAIGQIIYNAAAFRFNNVRLARVRGAEVGDELRLIELMISSSSYYDVGVRSSAFKSFLPMLNAQLMMLRGDFKGAASVFSQWLDSSGVSLDHRLSLVCRADFALCLARLGDNVRAVEFLNETGALNEASAPPDEAAIILHQKSFIYSMLGDSAMSVVCMEKSRVDLERHEQVQKDIISMLAVSVASAIGQ